MFRFRVSDLKISRLQQFPAEDVKTMFNALYPISRVARDFKNWDNMGLLRTKTNQISVTYTM